MRYKILVTTDKHCGHHFGLTPPDWQFEIKPKSRSKTVLVRNFAGEMQRCVWDWYADTVKSVGKVDLHIDLGDNVDGRAERSGGGELITSDQHEQCEMAVQASELIDARVRRMVYGTPYHTCSGYERWEKEVANALNAKIENQYFGEIGGITIDAKHKISRSSVPHGQGTASAKEWMWNLVNSNKSQQFEPKANLFLRGHIHEKFMCGMPKEWWVVNVPALQLFSNYGALQVLGSITVGMLYVEVENGRIEKCEILEPEIIVPGRKAENITKLLSQKKP